MSDQIGTATENPADVVRGLYDALSEGDVPGGLASQGREVVEIHRVVGGTVRKIDVYTKNPHELAAFYARAEAGSR